MPLRADLHEEDDGDAQAASDGCSGKCQMQRCHEVAEGVRSEQQ